MVRWGQYGREERLRHERKFVDARGIDKPAVKRQDILAGAAGLWLLVIPDCLNGNSLSTEEFRDNLRLRYNLLPLDMPQLCDGCGAPMTVEHALCCKVGGLVHIRQDDVADEWRHLCGCALSFGRVESEPQIYSSVSRQQRFNASSDTPSREEDQGSARRSHYLQCSSPCHHLQFHCRFCFFSCRHPPSCCRCQLRQ